MPPITASPSATPRDRSEASPPPAAASGASAGSKNDAGPDVISRGSRRSHERVELAARDHAGAPGGLAPLAEHDERGDGADVEALRRRLVAIGVELGDEHFALAVVGEFVFFFSSRRRHTRLTCDWSSDVCSSD